MNANNDSLSKMISNHIIPLCANAIWFQSEKSFVELDEAAEKRLREIIDLFVQLYKSVETEEVNLFHLDANKEPDEYRKSILQNLAKAMKSLIISPRLVNYEEHVLAVYVLSIWILCPSLISRKMIFIYLNKLISSHVI